MPGRIGASIEGLTELKTTFDSQAQRIEELISTISGRLSNTAWEGPAAERFRGQWGSDFEPALRNLRSALEECGVEVARRREALSDAGN